MSTRSIIGLALIVPTAVVIFFVLSASGTGERRASACTGVAPQCLPDMDFVDLNHEVHPSADVKGKVVVVNFWATWCKPCNKEIPAFNRVYEEYKDKGVVFFGVDQEDIAATDLLNFASDHEMTYPIIPMDATNGALVARNFGMAENIPTTFIYDKAGTRRTTHTGPLADDDLKHILDQLIAE
jgi:thiol-disulfide isomerase/thioredoxin